MNTYLVGGAVRDRLLGLESIDRDWVVVGSTVQEMLDLGYTQVGKDFPVFLHPKTKEEYALARTERKTGKGYTGFEVQADSSVTLEEDLSRRDLTINAMAIDTDNNLMDPFNGQEDLQNGLLKAVSPAFVEDPVRVLRIARFAAKFGSWGFKVSHETHQILKQMVANKELEALVPERVWKETEKALQTDRPDKFIEVLRACGALKVIFPEIDCLFGVPQVKKYHPEVDTGIHTLLVLQQAVKLTNDTKVRFAALVHDFGKGTTKADILPHHYGHEGRSKGLVKQLCRRLKTPKEYTELALLVAEYHGHFHKVADELTAKTIVKVLEALSAFRNPERLNSFILACQADQRGRPGYENKDFKQAGFLTQAFECASKVQAKGFVEKGLEGKQIKEAITRERIKQVQILIKHERV